LSAHPKRIGQSQRTINGTFPVLAFELQERRLNVTSVIIRDSSEFCDGRFEGRS